MPKRSNIRAKPKQQRLGTNKTEHLLTVTKVNVEWNEDNK